MAATATEAPPEAPPCRPAPAFKPAPEPWPSWAAADLAKSGIPLAEVLCLGWHVTTDGYAIPFTDAATGEPLQTPDGRPFTRIRLQNPTPTCKYLSPAGGGQFPYVLPAVHRHLSDNPAAPVVCTEGEKKALRATLAGVPMVGLCGIDSWAEGKGSRRPHPLLARYLTPGRRVVMLYDSDGATPEKATDFGLSAARFAAGVGALGCQFCRAFLPPGPDGAKQGADDYLQAGGTVQGLQKLVDAAATVATVPPPFPHRDGGALVLTTPEPPPQAPEPWTDPAPLSGAAGELPPWPWEALPTVLAEMGRAVAATVGVHESMAGAAVLGCASIALGNRVLLTIKAGGAPHTCRANTYWLVAAPVGAGKTPAVRPCLAPLQDWEAERLPAYKLALARWKAADEMAEVKRSVLKRDAQAAVKAQEDVRDIEHRLAMLEAEAEQEPAEPRLYVEDATSEALGRRLVGNAERMGVVSSEGRKVLRIAMGRYTAGAGGDYELWLAGHAGDPHRVDRQGRPPYDLRAPCLSALLFTQPDALASIGADPEARASGFLARFLYVVPPAGAAGAYPRDTVAEAVAAAYHRTIRAILELPTRGDTDGNPCPLPAALLPDAFDLWTELYAGWGGELNDAAGAGNLFLAQWLAKCREHAARLALVFAVVETVSTGTPWPAVLHVTVDNVANAARVCEHLKEHARRAAGVIGESQEVADARRVWAWIAANRPKLVELRQAEGCGAVAAVKPRDLMQAGVSGCTDAGAAPRVLRALESRGYLQAVLWHRTGTAARPHELWYFHPTAEGGPHGR
jgi:replicative DNA helicase